MAKGSGTTRPNREGGLKVGDDNFKGKTGMPQSLKTIENKAVYDAVMDAISRYHRVLGVRQKIVKLADLPDGYGGVHVTRNGESEGIYLNKDIFQPKEATTQSVSAWAKAGYDSGHLTKTNRPVGGIILHELGHATWNEHMTGQKYVDNVFRMTVSRKDGSVFFSRTFTKKALSQYLDDDFNKTGVFEGLVFDKAEGDYLFFGASVGHPQSDEYIPLIFRLSRMGDLDMKVDDQLDTNSDLHEDQNGADDDGV